MDFFSLTIDIDWAPDFAIDYTAEVLVQNQIKCTWFITHMSPAVERLKQHQDLFELGIHPNFLANSSHGKTDEEIFSYVMNLVPGARACRTHALVQSSHLMSKLVNQYGIGIDASLFLRETPNLEPHIIFYKHGGTGLIRIPYYWEDDLEMYNPEKDWHISAAKYHKPGMKIFNFHPVYIYLNADTMHDYEELKKIRPLTQVTADEMAPFRNKQNGTDTFFIELINYLNNNNLTAWNISEIASRWQAGELK